jgi:hypothetical protein
MKSKPSRAELSIAALALASIHMSVKTWLWTPNFANTIRPSIV